MGSQLDSLPFETHEQILSKLTDPKDFIRYCHTHKTPLCENHFSHAWQDLAERLERPFDGGCWKNTVLNWFRDLKLRREVYLAMEYYETDDDSDLLYSDETQQLLQKQFPGDFFTARYLHQETSNRLLAKYYARQVQTMKNLQLTDDELRELRIPQNIYSYDDQIITCGVSQKLLRCYLTPDFSFSTKSLEDKFWVMFYGMYTDWPCPATYTYKTLSIALVNICKRLRGTSRVWTLPPELWYIISDQIFLSWHSHAHRQRVFDAVNDLLKIWPSRQELVIWKGFILEDMAGKNKHMSQRFRQTLEQIKDNRPICGDMDHKPIPREYRNLL